MIMRRFLKWFFVLAILAPISVGTVMGYTKGWPPNWKEANWGTSGTLPQASTLQPATVIILASRTGRWKGIFAEHMSIVLKPAGAPQWTRYDVVGWGNPVRKDAYVADAFWYGNTPRVIYRMEGDKAAALIPAIEANIASYPFQAEGSYHIWPGPNSNTFVSWVVRHTDGLDTELSPVAVGKDWLGWAGYAPAPSKTGYTVSLAGVIGGTLAWKEGLELHLLGSTIGIDPDDLAIKLPTLGKLSLL
jgi:hypothetical protein